MATFSHIAVNVSDLERSVRFYAAALEPLSFTLSDRAEGQYARFTNGRDAVLVLSQVPPEHLQRPYHRKAVGLAHLAFAVPSAAALDRVAERLRGLGIPLLGRGRQSSDYRRGYECLFFEDHDRIMIEVVHHDPHYFSTEPP